MTEVTSAFTNIKEDLFDRKENSSFYYLALLSLTVLFFLLMLGNGTGILGALGRAIGFFILIILGYNLIDWNLETTENFELWREKREVDQKVNLRILETSKLVDRAAEGEKLSEENIAEKIRDVFFIKLKERKDLSEGGLRALLDDQKELRKVIQDEKISDFILYGFEDREAHEEKKKDDGIIKKTKLFGSSGKNGEKQKKEIERMIRRIERWE